MQPETAAQAIEPPPAIAALKRAVEILGTQSAVAREIESSASFVSQLLDGLRQIPPERCPNVERATGGQVVVEALRPDVRWQRVRDRKWPHPSGRPCIDPAG